MIEIVIECHCHTKIQFISSGIDKKKVFHVFTHFVVDKNASQFSGRINKMIIIENNHIFLTKNIRNIFTIFHECLC